MDSAIASFVDPIRNEEEHKSNYQYITAAVSEGSISIQDLIIRLEDYLTSTDDKIRNRATFLLANLLTDHSELHFTAPVVHLFIVFFCRRLSDYPSIIPSLQALTAIMMYHDAIVDSKYFDYIDMFRTIFKEIYVQGLAQNIRQKVFELYKTAFGQKNVSLSLRNEVSEIVEGVTKSFDGEKDPRCLVVAMQAIAAMAISLSPNLSNSDAEKIFDCSSCYFPITFQPPSNDPFGITNAQLTNCLLDCLCSHKNIVPYLLPYLLTQLANSLDSDSQSIAEAKAARKQGLMCILQICKLYSPVILFANTSDESSIDSPTTNVEPVIELLFDCVANELQGNNPFATDSLAVKSIETESFYSLYVIYEICLLISRESSSYSTSSNAISSTFLQNWNGIIDRILSRIYTTIADTTFQSINGRNAFAIACAVTASSSLCATAVCDKIIPLLLSSMDKDCNSIRNQIKLLRSGEKCEFSSTANVALLHNLISSIGTSLNNPFTFVVSGEDSHHSCGGNHDHHHHHGHSSSCSHNNKESNANNNNSYTNRFEEYDNCIINNDNSSFTLRKIHAYQQQSGIDYSMLGQSNPLAKHCEAITSKLLSAILLRESESNQQTIDEQIQSLIGICSDSSLSMNVAGICEMFLCAKSLAIRINPSQLSIDTQQLFHQFIRLLTYFAIDETTNSSLQLIKYCSVAILVSLTKVAIYEELLLTHSIRLLMQLSTDNSFGWNRLTVIWELLGKLCKISLYRSNNNRISSISSSDTDNDEHLLKRSRNVKGEASEGEEEGSAEVVNRSISISSVALPHILSHAVTMLTSAAATESHNNEEIAAMNALLCMLPEESTAKIETSNSSVLLVIRHLLGQSLLSVGSVPTAIATDCPLFQLINTAITSHTNTATATENVSVVSITCQLLRRLICSLGSISIDMQVNIAQAIATNLLSYTSQINIRTVLLCSLLVYVPVTSHHIQWNELLTRIAQVSLSILEEQIIAIASKCELMKEDESKSNQQYVWHLFAIAVNKLPNCNELSDLLITFKHKLLLLLAANTTILSNSNNNSQRQKQIIIIATQSLMWVTKAVSIRSELRIQSNNSNSNWQKEFIGIIYNLLLNPKEFITTYYEQQPQQQLQLQQFIELENTLLSFLQIQISNQLQIILTNKSFLLNTESVQNNNWNISMFWKQRLWTIFRCTINQTTITTLTAINTIATDRFQSLLRINSQLVLLQQKPIAFNAIDSNELEELNLLVIKAFGLCSSNPSEVNPSTSTSISASVSASVSAAVSISSENESEREKDLNNNNSNNEENLLLLITNVRKNAISSLQLLLEWNIDWFINKLKSIIPFLLKTLSEDSHAIVRAAALECISIITTIPYTYLFAYRRQVITALGIALDDKKRYIRLLAAAVRTKWYIMK